MEAIIRATPSLSDFLVQIDDGESSPRPQMDPAEKRGRGGDEAEAKGLSDQVDRLTREVYNLTVQKFLCWRSSASTNKQRYRVGKRLEVTGGMVL
ncbi:hypothetical protein Bca52824_054895 [Brassica carinata]|uniref:Uncharacterized protein n=1 Tax=Brassica carinata TaxID=52824 RepID=A0A8X7RAQ2_BRACI|nr:hypothetical protein Bca52824_054895 [Brassica carinata]